MSHIDARAERPSVPAAGADALPGSPEVVVLQLPEHGELPPLDLLEERGVVAVAVDGGAGVMRDRGRVPDLLVGDLDSIRPDDLAWCRTHGVPERLFPVAKDETDLELALGLAARSGAGRVVVLAGAGGRPDHLLTLLGVLSAPEGGGGEGVKVEAWIGSTWVGVVRPALPVCLALPLGSTLSLVSMHGPASGVRTSGLRWEVPGGLLPAGVGLGLSNEVVGTPARIGVEGGTLLALVPGRPR